MPPKRTRNLTEKHIYTEVATSEKSGDSEEEGLGPDEEQDEEVPALGDGPGSSRPRPEDTSAAHSASQTSSSGRTPATARSSGGFASSSERTSEATSSSLRSSSLLSEVAESEESATDTTPLIQHLVPRSEMPAPPEPKARPRIRPPREKVRPAGAGVRMTSFCSWRCLLGVSLSLGVVALIYAIRSQQCVISPWGSWGPCIPLSSISADVAAACGPGMRNRSRVIMSGQCGEPVLQQSKQCDLGECREPDYIQEAQVLPCNARSRKHVLKYAELSLGPKAWQALKSCDRAYLCCHACADVYLAAGPLTCGDVQLAPQPVFVAGRCLSCFGAGPGPGCKGGKPFCRRSFTSVAAGNSAQLCCLAVGPQRSGTERNVTHGTPAPDVEHFDRRPDSNAFLGVLQGAHSWPTSPDERSCQGRCFHDPVCQLYVYVSQKAAIRRWRGRCVTWDAETAEEQGRAEASSWIPEQGVYSGLKAHIRYADVVVTARTAEGANTGSQGTFQIFVCRAKAHCQMESPIRITPVSCTAGGDCLSPGTTAHFVGTVVVPENFELHAIRVQGGSADDWVFSELSVDCEGQVGSYQGRVRIHGGQPWTISVGCVTMAGWRVTAAPGSPCASKCYSGYGPDGWCWADTEQTVWGECSRDCRHRHRREPGSAMVESAVSCAELNWPTWSSFNSNHSVCGASDDWPLHGCSGPLSWDGAKEFCELIGARLCTREELEADEATGTGCDLDRQHVWSSTRCEHDGYMALPGASGYLHSVPPRCTPKTSTSAQVRCCADARKIEIIFKRSHRNSHVLPWHMHRGSSPGLSNWQVVAGTNYKGEDSFFLRSGMLDDQLPQDSQQVDVFLKDVPVSTLGGEVEFYFKVNTEPGWDKLHFFIDGVEETRAGFPVSGKVDWTLARFSFPARAGTELHTFQWRFSKDRSETAGDDVAAIDKITVFDVLSVD